MESVVEHEDRSMRGNDAPTKQLLLEVQGIKAELELLNSHKLVKVYNCIPRLLLFQFLKGISLGLGSVLGATIVVSGLVYLLSQIEFVPIVGEWVSSIIQEIQQ